VAEKDCPATRVTGSGPRRPLCPRPPPRVARGDRAQRLPGFKDHCQGPPITPCTRLTLRLTVENLSIHTPPTPPNRARGTQPSPPAYRHTHDGAHSPRPRPNEPHSLPRAVRAHLPQRQTQGEKKSGRAPPRHPRPPPPSSRKTGREKQEGPNSRRRPPTARRGRRPPGSRRQTRGERRKAGEDGRRLESRRSRTQHPGRRHQRATET